MRFDKHTNVPSNPHLAFRDRRMPICSGISSWHPSVPGRIVTAWSADVHGGAPQLLVRFPNADRQSNRGDFAVDATRLYFVIEDRQSDVFVAEMIAK